MAELKQKITRMAQAVIEEKDEKPAGEFPSLSARILNRIGCMFIAKPSDLGMPDDWYFSEADRVMPDPGQDSWQLQRFRVYTDNVRWEVKFRLARFAVVFNLAIVLLLGALLFSFGAAKFVKGKWDNRSSNSEVQQERARSDQETRARFMNRNQSSESLTPAQELELLKQQFRK